MQHTRRTAQHPRVRSLGAVLSLLCGVVLGIVPAVISPPAASALSEYTAISAGQNTTCGIRAGAVKCWGYAPGDGSQLSDVPVQAEGLESGVTDISVGVGRACAIHVGYVWCWGVADSNGIGDGVAGNRFMPVPIPSPIGANAIAVGAGSLYSCALYVGGQVYCWGENSVGRLGNGTTTASAFPTLVRLAAPARSISVGREHACAITDAGAAFCWGGSHYGQLGSGFTDSAVPRQVTGLASGVTAISAGRATTCAVVLAAAYCWGLGINGSLGSGPTDAYVVGRPQSVNDMLFGVTAISMGNEHGCAIKLATPYCWGRSGGGELGYSSSPAAARTRPEPVALYSGSVTGISAGNGYSCASMRAPSPATWCWGTSLYNQLGDGSNQSFLPVKVAEPIDGSIAYDRVETTATTATISWTESITTERGFLVYRVVGSTLVLVPGCPARVENLTSCTDTGLTPDTYYQYYVYAWNAVDNKTPGGYVTAHTLPLPLPGPTISFAFPTGPNSVRIGWEDTTSDEDGFRVYRYSPVGLALVATTAANVDFANISDPTINTLSVQTFVVNSFKGGSESPGDSYIFSYPLGAAGTTPSAPVNSSARRTSTGVRIAWLDTAADEAGYSVYRLEGTVSTLVAGCAAATPNLTSCDDNSPLTPGAFYRYYVYAWNNSGVSQASAPITYHAPNPLNRAIIQSAVPLSSSSIRLQWVDDSNDETSFAIMRYYPSVGQWITIRTAPANTTSLDIHYLDPGAQYVLIVKTIRQEDQVYANKAIWASTQAA
jgi:alpha-tubulin suppressor-like RCC1 family protein